MEIYFNELSLDPLEKLKYEHLIAMVQAYKELKAVGITSCRISGHDSEKLIRLLREVPNSANINNMYFSFFRLPFESELINEKQDEYIESEWLYNGKNCIGPAMAYILDALCFSIYHDIWKESNFHIHKNTTIIEIRNVSNDEHVKLHKDYIETKKEVELIECDIEPENKIVKIRHDHGENVLNEFCSRLVRCPYVKEIVNSLPFNLHDKNFIRKVKEDGIVELVLVWTDCKYGVVVRTTGRNYRETCKISDILREEYGYV